MITSPRVPSPFWASVSPVGEMEMVVLALLASRGFQEDGVFESELPGSTESKLKPCKLLSDSASAPWRHVTRSDWREAAEL